MNLYGLDEWIRRNPYDDDLEADPDFEPEPDAVDGDERAEAEAFEREAGRG